ILTAFSSYFFVRRTLTQVSPQSRQRSSRTPCCAPTNSSCDESHFGQRRASVGSVARRPLRVVDRRSAVRRRSFLGKGIHTEEVQRPCRTSLLQNGPTAPHSLKTSGGRQTYVSRVCQRRLFLHGRGDASRTSSDSSPTPRP